MSTAADLLARYLRQRGDLGEQELVFEGDPLAALRAPSEPAPASSTARAAPPAPARPVAPSPPPVPARPAAAPLPAALEAVRSAACACTACSLAGSRTNVVFGDGDPAAQLMVVGEAPGADEDRSGLPFVGRAGKLLDVLLASVGFPRETVYICNVLKCRPPGNRNPLPAEVEACSPFLQRQIDAVAPRAILAVGTFPAQTLLETTESIGRLRLTTHRYRDIPLVATYHPAALLRNPAWIRPVWHDLQRLRETIDGHTP